MYCDNCGAKIDGRKKFCDNCGAMIKNATQSDYAKAKDDSNSEGGPLPYQPTPPPLPVKNVGTVIYCLIFPGFGHLSLGKTKRGILYVGVFSVFCAFGPFFYGSGWITVSAIIFGVMGAFMLWVMIDTILLFRRYNKFVEKNLRKPKKRDKW